MDSEGLIRYEPNPTVLPTVVELHVIVKVSQVSFAILSALATEAMKDFSWLKPEKIQITGSPMGDVGIRFEVPEGRAVPKSYKSVYALRNYTTYPR